MGEKGVKVRERERERGKMLTDCRVAVPLDPATFPSHFLSLSDLLPCEHWFGR